MQRLRSTLEAGVRLARVYLPLAALHKPYNSQLLVRAISLAQCQCKNNKSQSLLIRQSLPQPNHSISLSENPRCSLQELQHRPQLKSRNILKVPIQQTLMLSKRRLVISRSKTDNLRAKRQVRTKTGCHLSAIKHLKATDHLSRHHL